MAKDKKPEIASEHVFTIPLRREWSGTRRVMRAKRSVSSVSRFIIRKTHAKSVRMSQKLNVALWSGGAKNPPARIRVKASIDSEGLASVKLPEEITLEDEKKKFLEGKKEGKKEGAKEAGKTGGKEAAPEKKVEPDEKGGMPDRSDKVEKKDEEKPDSKPEAEAKSEDKK
jgi:large subunit ribosomal protein L31e